MPILIQGKGSDLLDQIESLLARRRDAAIRSILRTKELEADQYLPVEVSQRLRKVVLDELNEMHQLCIELVKAHQSPLVEINQYWLDKLEEIHSAVVKT